MSTHNPLSEKELDAELKEMFARELRKAMTPDPADYTPDGVYIQRHSDRPGCRCDACESAGYAATEPFWKMDTALALAIGAVPVLEDHGQSDQQWMLDGEKLGLMTGARSYYPNGPHYQQLSSHKDWCPSVNLNDAMFAAGKVDLFKQRVLGLTDEGKWGIWDVPGRGDGPWLLVEADSPALAICAAILKVTKS